MQLWGHHSHWKLWIPRQKVCSLKFQLCGSMYSVLLPQKTHSSCGDTHIIGCERCNGNLKSIPIPLCVHVSAFCVNKSIIRPIWGHIIYQLVINRAVLDIYRVLLIFISVFIVGEEFLMGKLFCKQDPIHLKIIFFRRRFMLYFTLYFCCYPGQWLQQIRSHGSTHSVNYTDI